MPLKTLVIVAVRLYAIYWLVESITNLWGIVPLFWMFPSRIGHADFFNVVAPFALFAGAFLIAIIIWRSAPKLSVKIVKDCDAQLDIARLTRNDLYAFAFVFLGLFFVVSSIFPTLMSGYRYYIFEYPLEEGNPEKGRYLWPFLSHIAALIAGFVCILGASRWAKKLIRLENKTEISSTTSPTA